jgi:hypothetical protein
MPKDGLESGPAEEGQTENPRSPLDQQNRQGNVEETL